MGIIKLNITLRQLRAFCLVNEYGSYSAAADALSMTQGALSHLINELERQLGFRVFDRTTRKIELTPEGREYLPHAEKVLAQMRELNEIQAGILAQRDSRFTLGSTAALIASEVAAMVHDFAAIAPGVQVEFKDYQPDALIDAVDQGKVDLAIGPRRQYLPATVQEKHLFSTPIMVVVAQNHPFAKMGEVRWESLKSQTLVFHDKRTLQQMSQVSGLDFSSSRVIELSQLHSILSVVESEEGVTLVAAYAERYLSVHKVVALPLIEPEAQMQIRLYAKQGRALPDVARQFQEFVAARSSAG